MVAQAASRDAPAVRSAGASLLSVRNVSVRFGGIVALDGVSFDVAPGQIAGLIGPNGAGKSTLFKSNQETDGPYRGMQTPADR